MQNSSNSKKVLYIVIVLLVIAIASVIIFGDTQIGPQKADFAATANPPTQATTTSAFGTK